MHRGTNQWLHQEQANRLLYVTPAISIMLALLRDTYEWLRSETTSLLRGAPHNSCRKILPSRRHGPAPECVDAVSDLAPEASGDKAPCKPSSATVPIEFGPSDCLRRLSTAEQF